MPRSGRRQVVAATAVSGDGWVLSYDPETNHLAGSRHAAERALRAARDAEAVPILGLFPVTATWDNPVGALAALVALQPGRAVITEAPPDVVEWLDARFVWLRAAEHGSVT